jgi:steroid delta-isomerase-like uncharacterized protein
MRGEEYKRLSREFVDGVNNNDREALVRLMDEDYTFHNFQGTFKGADEFYKGLQVFWEAFPDMKLHIEDQIADDNQVVNRVRMTGTHKGEFAGVPGTDTEVTTTAMAVYNFKDDKIVEMWSQWDVIGLLAQVGAKPMRPQDC